jgi:hypothetical protein
MDPIALESPCPGCGGDRTLQCEAAVVRVECDSCVVTVEYRVPPSVFADCDRETIPRVAGEYLRMISNQLASGFRSPREARRQEYLSGLRRSDRRRRRRRRGLAVRH